MNRPNVLFMMVDQLNYGDLGYMGHPVVKTPHLDALRADAVHFSRCYVQNAFCLPSRASYLSSQYLFNHREYGFTGLLDEDTPSMPKHFRAHGYNTFHVGKLHCNPYGENLGFNTLIPTLPEDMYQSTDMTDNFLVHCLNNSLPYPNDQIQGDDYNFPGIKRKLDGVYFTGVSEIAADDSIERYTADKAITFLEEDHTRPFFAHVSFDRPHGPWTPSPEYADLYPPDDIPLPGELTDQELSRMPTHIRRIITDGHWTVKKIGPDIMKKSLSLYYGLITQVDDQIGRIIAALKRNGLYDNTVIVFCADHGDMAGHKGLFDKYSNSVFHDAIIRTPLLVKLPAQQGKGMEVNRLTEAIDLFPTLGDLCSVETDTLPLDGNSLVPLTQDPETSEWIDEAFSESYAIKMLVRDGKKFIYYVNTDAGELYDLESDPDERDNLYGDPACRELIQDMKLGIIKRMTKQVSATRRDHIRSLFDTTATRAIGAMDPLFKWEKGIVEGGGFWMLFRDNRRLTYIPFDDDLRFEQLDPERKTDGVTWFYEPCEDKEALDNALNELLNYIATKIRPISLMTGNQTIWDNMLRTNGAGLC